MARISVPFLLMIFSFLSGCAPPRPATVPADAVYSGGPKIGAWLHCTAEGDGYRCDVYTPNGGLTYRGSFDYLGELPHCDAGLEYPFHSGYLMPHLVRSVDDELYIAEASNTMALEASIADRFGELYHVRPTSVTVTRENTCGDGRYVATFQNFPHPIHGNVWAGKFFQVWGYDTVSGEKIR